MSSEFEGEQTKHPRKAKPAAEAATPVSFSPTARLEALTKDRIDALESDKQTLQSECVRLRSEVLLLTGENARLIEALNNAESNSVLATVLIGVGGFLVSYAAFTGNLATKVADVAVGALLAGIALLTWQTARRWGRG